MAGLEIAVLAAARRRPEHRRPPTSACSRTRSSASSSATTARSRSVYDKRAGREVLAGPRQPAVGVRRQAARVGRLGPRGDVRRGRARSCPRPTRSGSSRPGPHRAAIRVTRRFRDSRVVQDVRLWAGSAADRAVHHGSTGTTGAGCSRRASRSRSARRARRSRPRSASSSARRTATRRGTPRASRCRATASPTCPSPATGPRCSTTAATATTRCGNELGLSLLRSPVWPDPLADEGEQELTYALYPHAGGWLEGGVLAEAEDLNRPLLAPPHPRRRGRVAAPAARRRAAGRARRAEGARGRGRAAAARLRAAGRARPRRARAAAPGWTADAALDLLERPTGAPERPELGPFAVRSWRLVRRPGA